MNTPEETPGLNLTIRIDWSEMDLFGHVNNLSFFKYVQAGRVNYWQEMGLYNSYPETGTGPVLKSFECEFLKPLHFPGSVHVITRMEFMKNTSFGFAHVLKNDAGDIAAIAKDVIVTFDFSTGTKIPVPKQFRDAASKIEGRNFQAQ